MPLAGSNDESWCQGLDGLASRTAAYYQQGARFAKWYVSYLRFFFFLAGFQLSWSINLPVFLLIDEFRRTVVSIPNGPSALAVKEAAWGLARYAAISQVRKVQTIQKG